MTQLPPDFTPEFPRLADALASTMPDVSVRINTRKAGHAVSPSTDSVPWCATGRYLQSRPDFTFDPAMHQGLYYVQDASSMIYRHIITSIIGDSHEPLAVLDACAAPGGKTTAIIDALPDGSLVCANEYVPSRAETLHENLVKWGYPHVVVSRGDTSPFARMESIFDIIAADVPCSGEGMFRKDPQAVAQWTPRLVAECAALQREIVANLWPALKPGGHLIYSTCTFNRTENEDNVAWMLDNLDGAKLCEIPVDKSWNLTRRDGTLHFLPGDIRGEGLTVALLRKSADADCRLSKVAKAKPLKPSLHSRTISTWADTTGYTAVDEADRIYLQPNQWASIIATLARHIKMPWGAGVEAATVKGRDIVPSHALALSTLLRPDGFTTAAIDYTTAIAYLRREAIALAEGTPRGIVLLTYGGHPLGFVKNLGNRANNLYPQSWRILSTHIPDIPPTVL